MPLLICILALTNSWPDDPTGDVDDRRSLSDDAADADESSDDGTFPSNGHSPLPAGKQISHFTVDRQIYGGRFCEVYSGIDRRTNASCVVKIEFFDVTFKSLEQEAKVIRRLPQSERFPTLLASGQCDDFNYLALPAFGPGLRILSRKLPGKHYSVYSAVRLGLEMLNCIEELHEHGFIHGDIKPNNFVIRPNRRYPVVLIDYGVSQRYRDAQTGKHYEMSYVGEFIGTCQFASIYSQNGLQVSRRDDLISWFYCVFALTVGWLPWPGSADCDKSLSIKSEITTASFLHGFPLHFHTMWDHIKHLSFAQTPDYQKLRESCQELIDGFDILGTPKFDWESMDRKELKKISLIPLEMSETVGDDEDDDEQLDLQF